MGSLTRFTFEIRVKVLEYLIFKKDGAELKELGKAVFPSELLTVDLRRKIFSAIQRISKLGHMKCNGNTWHVTETASEYLEYLKRNERFIIRSN